MCGFAKVPALGVVYSVVDFAGIALVEGAKQNKQCRNTETKTPQTSHRTGCSTKI